jgi:hypothetical protein
MNGGWFDQEAIDSERMDADMEMAELEQRGRRHALARCRCGHQRGAHVMIYPACKFCRCTEAVIPNDRPCPCGCSFSVTS